MQDMASDACWAPKTLLGSLHLFPVHENLQGRFGQLRCQRVAVIAREVDGGNECPLIKKKYHQAATVVLFGSCDRSS